MNFVAIGCFAVTIAITLAVTLWAARRSSGRADYYAAGARISGPQNGLAIAGDFMAATTFLGLTGMYFDSGVDPSGIYYLTPMVGMCLMMLWIAAPLRRAGKFTLGDVMTHRLGSPSVRVFAGVSTITISIIYLVGQLIGAGALISLLFGLPFGVAVVLVGVLMTVYVAGGGMLAATWVQIIKAVMLVTTVLTITVLCLIQGGGPAEIYRRAAEAHPLGAGLFVPGASKTDLFSAVSLAFGMTVGMMGLPHLLIRFFTVPDVKAARTSTVIATSIMGVVFVSLFAVVGPTAVALLKSNPLYVNAAGAVAGGPNMVSIQLTHALGGPVLMGITSAVAFATILAVVAGLVMATASAAGNDLYAVLKKNRSEKQELLVFRLSAAGVAVVAILLAFAFQKVNVAFMSALAFAVAASANVPVILLALYWKRLTTAGALSGGVFGLVASVILIALGPAVWVKILHNPAPIFPSDYPALLVAPIALIVAVAVSLARPSAQAAGVAAAAE